MCGYVVCSVIPVGVSVGISVSVRKLISDKSTQTCLYDQPAKEEPSRYFTDNTDQFTDN